MEWEDRIRIIVPPVVIALLVFLGVMASFVAGGVHSTEAGTDALSAQVPARSNVVLVLENESGAAELICIASANPRSGALTVMTVPPENSTEIAGSSQTLGAALSIGGAQMLVEKLGGLVPLPLHHYVVVRRETFADAMAALGVDTAAYSRAATPAQRLSAGGELCKAAARALAESERELADLNAFFGRVKTDFSGYSLERYGEFLARLDFSGAEKTDFPGSFDARKTTFTTDRAALGEAVNRLLSER